MRPGPCLLELAREPEEHGFVSEIGLLEVVPDIPARIVINERTGTVVAGEHVTISTTAVAHGSLFIVTAETPEVSQPNPFSQGSTAVVPRTQVGVNEQKPRLNVMPQSVTVADVARALNALGVNETDAIFDTSLTRLDDWKARFERPLAESWAASISA